MLISVFSCTESHEKVEIKKLRHPNPTEYTFHRPIQSLHDTVIRMFNFTNQFNDIVLKKTFNQQSDDGVTDNIIFHPETADSSVSGSDYFKIANNKNDIFLDHLEDWSSSVYHHKNVPFKYTVKFATKLKAIDKDNTLLSIKPFDAEIYNGSKCCGPCLGNYALAQKVQPTTVEEYTLILFIAEHLGVTGLQPIEIPK